MIARVEPGGRQLMDCEAFITWATWLTDVTRSKVRRHCRPVEYDPATGRALYDAQAAASVLAEVEGRKSGAIPVPWRRRRARPRIGTRRVGGA